MTEIHNEPASNSPVYDLEPGEIAEPHLRERRKHRKEEKSSRKEKRKSQLSHSPSYRRLSYREREKLRHHRSPSPSHRRREDRHRDKKSKKHKRHRHDEREDEDMMELDVAVPRSDAEEIEERRRRIEAIKSKYQKPAESQMKAETPVQECGTPTVSIENGKESPEEATLDSVSSAECAFMENGLKSPSEVEIDVKSFENMDRANCSADRCEILNDEKHDKEKLLNEHPLSLTRSVELDDIFCETPDNGTQKPYHGLDNAVKKAAANRGLIDVYDDPDGYYKFCIGEILDSRYEILSFKGKGVFSIVLRAKDKVRKDESGEYPEVCIKVIRANDLMRNCGKREEQYLKTLATSDPENKRHCIRLLRSFVYRGHLCLVFEPMAMNLRELTKKFGRDVGLSLDGVGHFTAQLLVALKHLKMNKLLHADIKPDNILVNEKFSRVKLCDFGSAMEDWRTEITPYVCSRFYRPPEVILGLNYGYGMDMWSLGCVIYEMFTGQYLFPGRNNNAMLKHMMDVKGPFPKKLLKKASFADEHFEKDVNMSFIETDVDKFTKKPTKKRLISNPTVKHNFHTLLSKFARGCQPRMVTQLADLLEKMMMLDPEKRIDVDEAIRHPFVRAFLHRAKNVQKNEKAAA